LISFGGIWKFPKEATLPDIREVGLVVVAVVVEEAQAQQVQQAIHR
jgi:hypothetical protein